MKIDGVYNEDASNKYYKITKAKELDGVFDEVVIEEEEMTKDKVVMVSLMQLLLKKIKN